VSTCEKESLLDINAVANWTGLSVGTLYHFVSQRRIPFVRISPRCIRFVPSQVREWIGAKAVEATCDRRD
jgi:excisionase family DNA binding protein